MQAFADNVGAMTELPDMLEVVRAPRELDGFASEHDAQLTVHAARQRRGLVAGLSCSRWPRGTASCPGAVPGRLVLPSGEDGAPAVLTLAFDAQAALADEPELAALREVTLGARRAADARARPSRSPPGSRSRRQLADDMDATLIDDQGHAVTLHAFNAIGRELGQMYRALEARDLAAGSASARRLFS